MSPRRHSSDSDESDEALLDRFLAGDEQAFDSLTCKYVDRVYGTCLRILRDRQAARDATQETFRKAHRGAGGFQRRSAFYTWLYRIAVNTCFDELRRRKRRKRRWRVEPLPEDDVLRDTSPKMSDPAKRVVIQELRLVIEKALFKLPLKYRVVVTLKYVEGLSENEISEILRIPIGTVKSRSARGLKMLRKNWGLRMLAKELWNLGDPPDHPKG